MAKRITEFGALQQKFSEVDVQLKTLQQTRQQDIWQLLYRWSLRVSNATLFYASAAAVAGICTRG